MAISHNHSGNERNDDHRPPEQERISSSQHRSETQQARTSSPPRQVTIPSREPSLPSPRDNEFANVGLATYIVEPERRFGSPPREVENIGQVQPDAGATEQRSTPPYSTDHPTSAPPSEAHSTTNGIYTNNNSTRRVGRDVVVHQQRSSLTDNTSAMHREENGARNGNNGDRTSQGDNRQQASRD